MKMLIKYEFRKTWMTKGIVLGIAAVAEIAFLLGIAIGDGRRMGRDLIAISVPLLVMIAIFGVLFIGVQSVVTLHRDMNTKQGYMLYMTPRSSYQVLGAKFLENGLSLVCAAAAFFLLGMLDMTLLFSRFGQLDELWQTFNEVFRMLNAQIELNTRGFLILNVSMLASWLATVSMAYFADIVSSAILNGKKFNILITFLLFIALSVVMNWLQGAFQEPNAAVSQILLIRAVVAAAYAVAMYFLSAYVMDRYLSV